MLQLEKKITYTLKIVLAGAAAVGKTSIIQRFITHKFESSYKATFSVDFFLKDGAHFVFPEFFEGVNK